jgi:hypothetical protein
MIRIPKDQPQPVVPFQPIILPTTMRITMIPPNRIHQCLNRIPIRQPPQNQPAPLNTQQRPRMMLQILSPNPINLVAQLLRTPLGEGW